MVCVFLTFSEKPTFSHVQRTRHKEFGIQKYHILKYMAIGVKQGGFLDTIYKQARTLLRHSN